MFYTSFVKCFLTICFSSAEPPKTSDPPYNFENIHDIMLIKPKVKLRELAETMKMSFLVYSTSNVIFSKVYAFAYSGPTSNSYYELLAEVTRWRAYWPV